jgi:F420-0:gamma-glutamyl ligase
VGQRRDAAAARTRAGRVDKFNARIKTKDGELLDCLVSAAPITMGGAQCVLWVMQDITEQRQFELELVTAIEAVMQDASWFSRNVLEKLANLRAR